MRALAFVLDGLVENVILGNPADWPGAYDVTDMGTRPAPGWSFADGEFSPPVALPPPARSRITRLAFRNRFSTAELVALEMAAIDDPAAAAPQRQLAASLRVMQANLQAATFIDLQRPDTRAGVQQLEAVGLLAAGRALAILDAPVEDSEAPLE